MTATFQKTAEAVLDYTIEWEALLVGGDSLISSVWTAATGLIGATGITGTKTFAFAQGGSLSGGDGTGKYAVINAVTTAQGRTINRAFYIQIVDVFVLS